MAGPGADPPAALGVHEACGDTGAGPLLFATAGRPSAQPASAVAGRAADRRSSGAGVGAARPGHRADDHLRRGDGDVSGGAAALVVPWHGRRSEEHTSELQSLMRISYAVFCLKKKTTKEE